MRKANVISINEARKSLIRNFKLNVYDGWNGTKEEFLITNICRSKIEGKIDIKGKSCHHTMTEQEFSRLARYGHYESWKTVGDYAFTNRVRLVVAEKPVKTVKITLFGGFHNSDAINAIIRQSDLEDLKTNNIAIEDALSRQLEHLNRHFCGIKGCSCGGVNRASWYKS